MKQQFKAMLDEDRAVSPVIGVILMVAVTVILAAVISTFVLGLGDDLRQAPQSSLNAADASNSYDNSADDDQAFIVSQNGGDAIAFSEMTILITGDSIDTLRFDQSDWTAGDLTVQYDGDTPNATDEFAVGDAITIQNIDTDPETDLTPGDSYRIRLIHLPSDSILLDEDVTLR